MTPLTVGTKFTLVCIVATMAATAGPAELDTAFHRTGVADFAPQLEVCPIDLEACPQVVVELPTCPIGRAVAKTTIGAEFLLVGIILKMTIHTGFRRIFEPGGFMTIPARRIFV
jgi:hypothetical protein